jgi:hypothetical protein
MACWTHATDCRETRLLDAMGDHQDAFQYSGTVIGSRRASLLREAGLPSRWACSGPSTSSSPPVLWRDMPLGLSLCTVPQTSMLSGSSGTRQSGSFRPQGHMFNTMFGVHQQMGNIHRPDRLDGALATCYWQERELLRTASGSCRRAGTCARRPGHGAACSCAPALAGLQMHIVHH